MNKTNISWLRNPDGSKGYTWNIATGCTPISAACTHCWARRLAETRLRGRCGYPQDEPFRVTLHPERLDEPLQLHKPSRIFPCSMSDLFHPDIPTDYIDRIFEVMIAASMHSYYVLTKRPERMVEYCLKLGAPRPWIWLSATIESQDYIGRAEYLVKLARLGWHTFVSCEPCLSAIDLMLYLARDRQSGVEWTITGGETGPNARPMRLAWADDLLAQCREAGIPFHCKAMGDWWNRQELARPKILDIKEFPDA